MCAANYSILKKHSYLCPRKFTLRVDNQALAWLKPYSTDQAINGRWIMALEKYPFAIQHRPRTQHRNADVLSKRKNDYKKHERQLEELPSIAEKWNFLSQEECDKLPMVPWFDIRVIPEPSRTAQAPQELRQGTPTNNVESGACTQPSSEYRFS